MSANIVTVDEESLRKDIKNLVRKTVEETLNALLNEEASELVGSIIPTGAAPIPLKPEHKKIQCHASQKYSLA